MNVFVSNKAFWIKLILAITVVLLALAWKNSATEKNTVGLSALKPALTVVTTVLQPVKWMRTLAANGSVRAWQEAIVSAEVTGVRIMDVRVSVGDQVKKGQLLASLETGMMQANAAESRAVLQENEALFVEASRNVLRMRKLAKAGFVSAEKLEQARTQENTARAKLAAQHARCQVSALRLSQQRIVAPDSGIISARSATVGAITQPGVALFRLIRQGRLEWHADLTAEALSAIRLGMNVSLSTAQGRVVKGIVRAIAPSLNPKTRYGQVLVRLPRHSGLIAGMFASGTFHLDKQAVPVLALPQSAVVLRNGYAYVFVVDASSHVHEHKVKIGRRYAEQIEIIAGLDKGVTVVKSGGEFLVDGDGVRVIGDTK
ncbi:MAG: efflux RND transporter periplasmic adaptor subunit [Gallionella sp.]